MTPFITAELEAVEVTEDNHQAWLAKALHTLAGQLSYTNDYYCPLIDAAKYLEQKQVWK